MAQATIWDVGDSLFNKGRNQTFERDFNRLAEMLRATTDPEMKRVIESKMIDSLPDPAMRQAAQQNMQRKYAESPDARIFGNIDKKIGSFDTVSGADKVYSFNKETGEAKPLFDSPKSMDTFSAIRGNDNTYVLDKKTGKTTPVEEDMSNITATDPNITPTPTEQKTLESFFGGMKQDTRNGRKWFDDTLGINQVTKGISDYMNHLTKDLGMKPDEAKRKAQIELGSLRDKESSSYFQRFPQDTESNSDKIFGGSVPVNQPTQAQAHGVFGKLLNGQQPQDTNNNAPQAQAVDGSITTNPKDANEIPLQNMGIMGTLSESMKTGNFYKRDDDFSMNASDISEPMTLIGGAEQEGMATISNTPTATSPPPTNVKALQSQTAVKGILAGYKKQNAASTLNPEMVKRKYPVTSGYLNELSPEDQQFILAEMEKGVSDEQLKKYFEK